MHDKRNPYRPYSIPSKQWEQDDRRGEVERQRQADAAHRAMLASLSSPAAVVKRLPSVSTKLRSSGAAVSFPACPDASRSRKKAKSLFPWYGWLFVAFMILDHLLK